MTPCPVDFRFWFRIASIPAKIGAAKLVPPATVSFMLFASRKPFEQLPGTRDAVSLEQYKYPV